MQNRQAQRGNLGKAGGAAGLSASGSAGKQTGGDTKPTQKETKNVPTGGRQDPYRSYNFVVEIDGVAQAGFMECTGLEAETEIIDYREGNEPNTIRQLPGLTVYANIILRRGLTDSKELYDWRKSVISGDIVRKGGSIILLDDKRKEVARWSFVEGWPSRWSGPELNAIESEVAIEELEICHEGFERA